MEEHMVPSDTPGIQLYLRNKRLSSATPERILLFVHGSTYPAETSFDLPLGGLSFMDFLARDGWDVWLVDLRAYADRNFTVGSVLQFVVGMGLYGGTYVMPIFLGRVRGYNALQIGETVIIYGIFMCMSAPIAGTLSTGGSLWLNLFGKVGKDVEHGA